MRKHIVLTVGLAALLASAAQASQEQLAESIRQARQEAEMTAAQLKTTLEALNALVSQAKGDLKPAFQAFRLEVPKTQAAASATTSRVQTMSQERDRYFTSWQNTISGINNPSLQKKAQKRLDKVSASYARVEAAFQTAADKFRPFLSDLADVEKVLSQDVTAAGVKAIKGTVRQANWDHKFVSSAINSALKEMGKMEKALSGEAT